MQKSLCAAAGASFKHQSPSHGAVQIGQRSRHKVDVCDRLQEDDKQQSKSKAVGGSDKEGSEGHMSHSAETASGHYQNIGKRFAMLETFGLI